MNLAVRVVSGVVLVAIIAAALWIGTPAVATVVGAGALIGAWELRGLLGRMGPTPPVWLILPLSVWLGIRFVLPASDMAADWAFAAAAVIGLLAGLVHPRRASPAGRSRWAAPPTSGSASASGWRSIAGTSPTPTTSDSGSSSSPWQARSSATRRRTSSVPRSAATPSSIRSRRASRWRERSPVPSRRCWSAPSPGRG